MKKNLLLPIGSLVLLLAAASCKKGDTGPQGPKGNANVVYSAWFTPGTYKKDTVFGIWGFSYSQPVAEITAGVLDSGSVLTFAKLFGYNPAVWPTNQVAQLPVTITYQQSGLQNDTWHALLSPGNLRIRFQNDHNIYTTIANTHQFRYVIIPGGTPGGRTTQLNYQQICAKYGIPE